MQQIQTLYEINAFNFNKVVNLMLKEGYEILNSNCGVLQDGREFYQAILVRTVEEKVEDPDIMKGEGYIAVDEENIITFVGTRKPLGKHSGQLWKTNAIQYYGVGSVLQRVPYTILEKWHS